MASPQEIDDIRNNSRQRDMILAPNEYAFISDETKGEVNCFVGPNKTSLAGTDRPVNFDLKSKRFRACDLASATQTFQTAPEGWYVILKNPAENDKHPSSGKTSTPPLEVGKKINIAGPASFALWPGQMAKVVQGHSLRSNEFLVVRVYDEKAARTNWSKAVIKTQSVDTLVDPAGESKEAAKKKAAAAKQAAVDGIAEADLTMGKQFVIRGTEVSFYIPPTGVEIVPERVNGEERYVREAVSLERLEYCLLLDQNGNKRYVQGPDVVFPRPTEKFVEAPIKSNPDKVKAKKFRAQELTAQMGIHIRVIADYTEETGEKRTVGQELFITGETTPVYFPREEHAIIKYGDQDVHFGIAIPSGEARYVLDRNTGVISLVVGPMVFLADPRSQVIAQRALPLQLCELLYPNNDEAIAINAQRLGVEDVDFVGVAGSGNAAFLNNSYVRSADQDENYGAVGAVVTPDTNRRIMIKSASKSLPGDSFDRKSKFTAPRSVILNTKYDGAVTTTIWTGYAMLLIRKSGERRLVQGPGTFMLEYDESPQVITLSTGKPKTTDKPLKTVFLQTTANMVSDIIEVETRDFCKLNVKLSYRVNFEGDPNQWFNVDNYVKFLCDHMRSRVRSQIQKLGIEEFYGNHTDLLRDIILGKSKGDGAPRAGTTFAENGMRIYDVEVLKVDMQNRDVEQMLVNAQRETIQNALTLAAERRKLSHIKENEVIKRDIAETNAETRRLNFALQADEAKRKLELDITIIETNAKTIAERILRDREANEARQQSELLTERASAEIAEVRRASEALDAAAAQEQKKLDQQLELAKLNAQVSAIVEKAKAVSPDLIAALNAFGERAMVEKVAEAMAPLSILGGGSVVDVLKKLLEGTSIAKQLEAPLNGVTTSASRSKSAHS